MTARHDLLDEAFKLISLDRAEEYGDAKHNFNRLARMWSAYLDVNLTAAQVCDMMTLLKMSRLANNPEHQDSRVDAIGYLALGGEV